MTAHITKTWFEDGKLITEVLEEKEIYKREWIGLSNEQFAEACRIAENGNYLVAFQRIQNWIKENNT